MDILGVLLYMPWHILYACMWVSSDIQMVDISVISLYPFWNIYI